MATATKNARTIVSSQSNGAGATTRGTLDLRTAFGGLLTLKITNGATGPTVQCVARTMFAHNDGATPAAAAEGTDWKRGPIPEVGNGTANDTIGRWGWEIGPGAMHIEVEFTGNTDQAVTVEAVFSEVTSIS